MGVWMRQPTEPSEGAQSQSLQQVQEAVRLLEAAGISPLARPRILAAARAIGTPLELQGWYQAAWELENSGRYMRRGNGESEWLELVAAVPHLSGTSRPAQVRQARQSAVQELFSGESAWLVGALRSELERIHDADALFALADTIVDLSPIEAERCLRAVAENDPQQY